MDLNINLIRHRKKKKLLTCGQDVVPQTFGVNISLVHHIRISTINVSSVMLGIETVFGRPYNLPSILDRLLNFKSQYRMNGSYKPEGKYDTSPNEKI